MSKQNNNQANEVPIYGVIDERTKLVAFQGDAYSARFMMFALLIDVIIRGLAPSNPVTSANWDLLLIVIVGGFISTIYQIKNKIMLCRPISKSLLAIGALMAISAIIAVIASYYIK